MSEEQNIAKDLQVLADLHTARALPHDTVSAWRQLLTHAYERGFAAGYRAARTDRALANQLDARSTQEGPNQ